MKKYPRIYSLSTIGIIHHQKNDYIFHPYCTDFIGDSDSGKSIIADFTATYICWFFRFPFRNHTSQRQTRT